MSHQDWETVVFANNTKKPEQKPTNKKHAVSKLDKLANADDVADMKQGKTKKYGKQIQQLRMAKGMNQKTFAIFLNVSEAVIKDYEADRIQPTGNIRDRIMRKTGCKL